MGSRRGAEGAEDGAGKRQEEIGECGSWTAGEGSRQGRLGHLFLVEPSSV